MEDIHIRKTQYVIHSNSTLKENNNKKRNHIIKYTVKVEKLKFLKETCKSSKKVIKY